MSFQALNQQRESSETTQESLDITSDTLAALKRQVQQLEEKLSLSEGKRVDAETVLDGILASRSWKLTSLFRSFSSYARALWPLIEFGSVRCKVLPQTSLELINAQGFLRVTGPTPTFSVVTNENVRPGWVRISSDLTTEDGQMNFLLYFGRGEEFSATSRAWLLLSQDETEAPLLRLPSGTTTLRLDPFEGASPFHISELNVKPLGSLQVLWALFRKHILSVSSNPAVVRRRLVKAWALFRSGGITALRHRLLDQSERTDYPEWVKKYDTLNESDREQIRRHIKTFDFLPTVSVIMPTYNTPSDVLCLAIESVQKQLYPNWELCIADDNSSDQHVRETIERYAAKDARIKYVLRTENGHISEASNSAISLSSGEYLALLDHDDELTEHALYHVVYALNKNRNVSYIYSDEDKKTRQGVRFNPYFKPDWNRDLFLAQNYTCHLSVYRADLVKQLGGYRSICNGAQDWDLTLRVVDCISPDQIKHIPHILYHWRVMEGSTAQSTSFKPYVLEAQQRAVEEHLERRGERANVTILNDISQLRVQFDVPDPHPEITLVIPTKDQKNILKKCVDSILKKTRYDSFKLVIVSNNSCQDETFSYFRELSEDPRIEIVEDNRPFNFSQLNNNAVSHISSPLVGFLNNDLEVVSGDWLKEMVSYALREGVGAVGAKLLYPNNLIQHAGVVLGIGGVAGHNHKGRPRHDVGYFNRVALPSNFSAVTGACLITRTELFREVGGFDEETLAVAFNDIDLCLKLGQAGYRIVYTPYAELYHYESISRGHENTPSKFKRFEGEVACMKERWDDILRLDPHYNPNLTLLHEDFSFSFPPRVKKPWRSFE